MKESTFYQGIVQEGMEQGMAVGMERGMERGMDRGRAAEARAVVIRGGARKFGPPDAALQARINAIDNLPILEALIDRLLDGAATNWNDLLTPPG